MGRHCPFKLSPSCAPFLFVPYAFDSSAFSNTLKMLCSFSSPGLSFAGPSLKWPCLLCTLLPPFILLPSCLKRQLQLACPHCLFLLSNPDFLGSSVAYVTVFNVYFIMSLLKLKTCPTYLSLAAGWVHQRCWKNDIGHCRSRCFHTERYKLLCMNKLNCCTPIKLEEYTQRPLPPLLPTADNDYFTWGASPNTPGTGPNDEMPISTVDTLMTETIAFKKKVSTPPMTHLLQSRTSPSGYEGSEIMTGNIIQGAKSTDVVSSGTFLRYLLFHRGLDDMKTDIMLLPRQEPRELPFN